MKTDKSRFNNKSFWLLAVLVLAAVAGAGWYVAGRNATGNPPPRSGPPGMGPQPVQVATAGVADLPVYLSGLGTVTAANTVTVRSRVDGELIRLHFTEGQQVKAGQLLAEIDPRSFQVALSQAQGQLATNQASLANARADMVRYETLLRQDSITRQKYDAQVALVRQLEGTVISDKAAVDAARLQLDYSRITAPIDGRVGLKQIDVGNQVKSGDATGIVVITQVQPINLVFTIPESQLQSVLVPLRAGETLPVEAWDREMKKVLAVGRLLTVDNQIDPTTGTVKLKAEFPNPDLALFPNQFVNARVRVATRQAAVVVPAAAVQLGKQGSFVWKVGEGDKVTMTPVRTGVADGERVEIVEGVAPGERLVTDGVDRLKDGTRVQVIDPARPAAPVSGQEGSGPRPSAGQGGPAGAGRG